MQTRTNSNGKIGQGFFSWTLSIWKGAKAYKFVQVKITLNTVKVLLKDLKFFLMQDQHEHIENQTITV